MKNIKNQYQWDKIVFFDGECVLCNSSVDFLLKKDRKKRLKFASLQSELASSLLHKLQDNTDMEDTIIFYDEGRLFIKSTAVLKIASYLGMPWRAFSIFLIIPRSWRDYIYCIIARKRTKWFGKREHCRIPDKETAGRIIG